MAWRLLRPAQRNKPAERAWNHVAKRELARVAGRQLDDDDGVVSAVEEDMQLPMNNWAKACLVWFATGNK